MTEHNSLLEHEALLIGVLERPDRLTAAVLGMADRLPPDQRRLLHAEWRLQLQAHRALVRGLLADARSAAIRPGDVSGSWTRGHIPSRRVGIRGSR